MNVLRLPVFSTLFVLFACANEIGPRIEEFSISDLASGIGTTVTLHRDLVEGNKLEGELVAVTDDGILILLDAPMELTSGRWQFAELSFSMLRSIDLGDAGKSRVKSEGKAVDDARLSRLRLLSRYPQGLSAELKADLLAAYGETGVFIPTRK